MRELYTHKTERTPVCVHHERIWIPKFFGTIIIIVMDKKYYDTQRVCVFNITPKYSTSAVQLKIHFGQIIFSWKHGRYDREVRTIKIKQYWDTLWNVTV